MVGLVTITTLGYAANRRTGTRALSQRLGRLLWGITGGLLLYNYYALSMPGSALVTSLGNLAGLLLVVAGGVTGLALYRPLRQG
jgi:hypothetical protein